MAEMWRYDGGGVARKMREVWRYDAGGTPRKAREIWRYDPSGIARKVFSGSFVLTASTTSVFGSGNTTVKGGVPPATTTPVTLTVQGGMGPFTYAWATLSGTAATALSPAAATTTFRRNGAAPTQLGGINTYSGVVRCTVTDTGTGEAKTIDVTVVTQHSYDF